MTFGYPVRATVWKRSVTTRCTQRIACGATVTTLTWGRRRVGACPDLIR
jgi:hypothetical protein